MDEKDHPEGHPSCREPEASFLGGYIWTRHIMRETPQIELFWVNDSISSCVLMLRASCLLCGSAPAASFCGSKAMRFWLVLTTLCFSCRSIDWLRYLLCVPSYPHVNTHPHVAQPQTAPQPFSPTYPIGSTWLPRTKVTKFSKDVYRPSGHGTKTIKPYLALLMITKVPHIYIVWSTDTVARFYSTMSFFEDMNAHGAL